MCAVRPLADLPEVLLEPLDLFDALRLSHQPEHALRRLGRGEPRAQIHDPLKKRCVLRDRRFGRLERQPVLALGGIRDHAVTREPFDPVGAEELLLKQVARDPGVPHRDDDLSRVARAREIDGRERVLFGVGLRFVRGPNLVDDRDEERARLHDRPEHRLVEQDGDGGVEADELAVQLLHARVDLTHVLKELKDDRRAAEAIAR